MGNKIKPRPDEKTIASILKTPFPKRLKDEAVFRARVARLESHPEFGEDWAIETRKNFYDKEYIFDPREFYNGHAYVLREYCII